MTDEPDHGLPVVTEAELLRALSRRQRWLRDKIREGVIPPPRRLAGIRLWLRSELVEFFAALPREEPEDTSPETEAA